MITFLASWAAAAAVLLAGPILVHMLLRRHARRIVFPATRFLLPTRAAAVRVRRPSDIALLILRMAIVGAAVLAVMQPIVITPRRLASWDARMVRAVVVDTSASVGDSPDRARLVEQELTAFRAQRFDGPDVREAVTRAAAWLADSPPARREVVILSDFQRGAFDRADLDVLPNGAGVRTIRVGHPRPDAARAPLPVLFQGAVWKPAIQLDADSTSVRWTKSADASTPTWLTTAEPPAERDAAARVVNAALSGVAPGDGSRRVHVRFAGAAADSTGRQAVRTPWMVDAVLALRHSPLLRQTNASITTSEQNGRLVVDTSAAAQSLGAAAVVRAIVLAAHPASIADREAEVVPVADAELAQWRREAAPLSPTAGGPRPGPDSDSDARWFWGLALLLLGLETWLRQRTPSAAAQQVRDAA